MSEQNQDLNRGIIGVNGFRQNDRQPDQSGRINIGGLWYWLSGWEQEKNGRKFTSLQATIMTQDQVDKMLAKRAEKQAANAQQAPANAPTQQPTQPQQTQAPAGNTPPPVGEAAKPHQTQATQAAPNAPTDFDDDIPF